MADREDAPATPGRPFQVGAASVYAAGGPRLLCVSRDAKEDAMTRFGLWAILATAGPAAAAAPVFLFAPVPRWSEPPETEEVCAAIEMECEFFW